MVFRLHAVVRAADRELAADPLLVRYFKITGR